MALLIAVTLEPITGLPEDRFVNTFAFVGGNQMNDAELGGLASDIETFYNDAVAPQTTPVAHYINEFVSRVADACLIQIYDLTGALDGGPHGSPIFERTFTLGTTALLDNLPAEVAYKLRWEAFGRSEAPVETPDGIDPGTAVDRPKQRRTGGIYLGPLTILAATLTEAPVRPRQAFIDNVLEAGRVLAEDVSPAVAGPSAQLGVWSRSDLAIRSVEAVVVDNAFDTQRRRGAASTVTTRVATPLAGEQEEVVV